MVLVLGSVLLLLDPLAVSVMRFMLYVYHRLLDSDPVVAEVVSQWDVSCLLWLARFEGHVSVRAIRTTKALSCSFVADS